MYRSAFDRHTMQSTPVKFPYRINNTIRNVAYFVKEKILKWDINGTGFPLKNFGFSQKIEYCSLTKNFAYFL
jgi:hypothetical protein